jgi:hypothetical protein
LIFLESDSWKTHHCLPKLPVEVNVNFVCAIAEACLKQIHRNEILEKLVAAETLVHCQLRRVLLVLILISFVKVFVFYLPRLLGLFKISLLIGEALQTLWTTFVEWCLIEPHS